MMDENRKNYSGMDESAYLEEVTVRNIIALARKKTDEDVKRAVKAMFLSRYSLHKILSDENLEHAEEIRECINRIDENVEKFRWYFLLKEKDVYNY